MKHAQRNIKESYKYILQGTVDIHILWLSVLRLFILKSSHIKQHLLYLNCRESNQTERLNHFLPEEVVVKSTKKEIISFIRIMKDKKVFHKRDSKKYLVKLTSFNEYASWIAMMSQNFC